MEPESQSVINFRHIFKVKNNILYFAKLSPLRES